MVQKSGTRTVSEAPKYNCNWYRRTTACLCQAHSTTSILYTVHSIIFGEKAFRACFCRGGGLSTFCVCVFIRLHMTAQSDLALLLPRSVIIKGSMILDTKTSDQTRHSGHTLYRYFIPYVSDTFNLPTSYRRWWVWEKRGAN